MFEMMNCEHCKPTVYEKFVIFRKKIEVEQTLIRHHQRNIQRIGMIDPVQVYKYERQGITAIILNYRLFQKYQLYEYLTTFSAQCFWKELLQKQINAAVLQEKGSEISLNYEIIQETAKQLQLIYPEEIKFLFRYGNFLLNIIHNEYDALEMYKKAQNVYSSRMNKKAASMPVNEQSIFGENSASAIIIISATSTKIGIIVHANEELENILGYQRKEVIGKNISMIIPRPIAKVHDRLVQRYFETAKPTVIEIKRQLFGACKEGYLQQIELIVKIFPQINDKIVFVGFLQLHDRFEDMEPPKSDYEKLDKQYIITDLDGNITNVTEGLFRDLGLHAKFFQYSDSIFQQMFQIQKISHEIQEHDIQELLENEGSIINFDTRNILDNIELESLTSEEVMEVRANLGQYQAYVQLKRLVINPQYCTVHIYRVILLSKYNDNSNRQSLSALTFLNLNEGNAMEQSQNESNPNALNAYASKESIDMPNNVPQNSMSSMSSAASTAYSFNKIIKDFKKALGDRNTPKNLIFLNRIMITILLSTIILSIVDFTTLTTDIEKQQTESQSNLFSESRSLKITQLASNVRSYINIANGLEFDKYDGSYIQHIDRFEYLNSLIQYQASDLEDIHEYLTQKRSANQADQSQFEYEPIDLFRLDDSNTVSDYQLPYRVGFFSYLNQILAVKAADRSQLVLPEELIMVAPKKGRVIMSKSNTTELQKAAYFLMVNGLRQIRTKSEQATRHYQDQKSPDEVSPFVTILILGTFITVISFFTVLFQVWTIEQDKAEILSLYAILPLSEITKVYNSCDKYMIELNMGSLFSQVTNSISGSHAQRNTLNDDGSSEMAGTFAMIEGNGNMSITKNQRADMSADGFFSVQINGSNSKNNLQKGKPIRPSQVSEEDKEAEQQKQMMSTRFGNKKGSKSKSRINRFKGSELYSEMIKRTFSQIRILQTQEDLLNNARRVEQQKAAAIRNRNEGDAHDKEVEFKKSAKGQPSQKVANKKHHRKNKHKGKQLDDIFEEDPIEWTDPKKPIKRVNTHTSNNTTEEDDGDKQSQDGHHLHLKIVAQEQNNGEQMSEIEIEERKRYFFKTIKTKSWGKFIVDFIIGLIFSVYFIQVYVVHNYFQSELHEFQNATPIFFKRFSEPMLAFAFMRERIINNNTLDTFEGTTTRYGQNIDQYHNGKSSDNEQAITKLKIKYSAILEQIVTLIQVSDTEQFCSSIVGSSSQALKMIESLEAALIDQLPQNTDLTKDQPYQSQVNTIALIQEAAISGKVETLKALKIQGVDLNAPNYDRRTGLHFAAKYGKIEVVKYLIANGANGNGKDRWGATAMNYAGSNTEVQTFLKTVGVVEGLQQGDYNALASVYQSQKLSQDNQRAFYSAYFNDVNSLKILKAQGKLFVEATDQDGRSSLAIAASEGNLEAVKYLVQNRANVLLRDARKNDAIADSKRESRTQVYYYLQGVMSEKVIHDYCVDFEDGILRKGLQQQVGNFHKRFSDLQIKINSTANYPKRLSLLAPPLKQGQQPSADAYNVTTMKLYFSTQELYYHRVIDLIISTILSSENDYIVSYKSITQIIFLIFIAFQFVMLFILRSKLIDTMKEDIFQSRGILNLIPDNFFEQNRQKVEKLIKSLKD